MPARDRICKSQQLGKHLLEFRHIETDHRLAIYNTERTAEEAWFLHHHRQHFVFSHGSVVETHFFVRRALGRNDLVRGEVERF